MNESMNGLTYGVIGAAMAVHRELGPGLEEQDYELALQEEMNAQEIRHVNQHPIPVIYKDMRLDAGFRMDLLIENVLVVELKAVERIHPVHEAQLLTYLRLAHQQIGLLINFDVPVLKDGIMRRVMTKEPVSESTESLKSEHDLEGQIIGAAIEVHRHIGPGLLRSAYEECLCCELSLRRIPFTRSQPLPIRYRDVTLPAPAKIELIVAGQLPVMIVSNSLHLELNEARFLGRLRNGQWENGLLFNFGEKTLSGGLRSVVNPQFKP
jgi:GxxExxY protein